MIGATWLHSCLIGHYMEASTFIDNPLAKGVNKHNPVEPHAVVQPAPKGEVCLLDININTPPVPERAALNAVLKVNIFR